MTSVACTFERFFGQCSHEDEKKPARETFSDASALTRALHIYVKKPDGAAGNNLWTPSVHPLFYFHLRSFARERRPSILAKQNTTFFSASGAVQLQLKDHPWAIIRQCVCGSNMFYSHLCAQMAPSPRFPGLGFKKDGQVYALKSSSWKKSTQWSFAAINFRIIILAISTLGADDCS